MREPWYRDPLSVTAKLMIALVVVFMAQAINAVYLRVPFEEYLALSVEGLRRGFVWQVLTFQFLHGGLTHLLFNLMGLWFLGRIVEGFLGPRRYLVAYLGSGVAGGVLQSVLAWSFPAHFGGVLVGASAGLFGMLAIFCLLEPEAEVRVMFVLPLKARVLLWVAAGVAIFFTLVPAGGGIAHAAHLGGLAFGAYFIRRGWHHDFQPLPGAGWWQAWKRRPGRPAGRPVGRSGVPPVVGRNPRVTATPVAPEPPSDGEFMSREIDPILDKIAAHGIHSLTDRERQILEAARSRMGRR